MARQDIACRALRTAGDRRSALIVWTLVPAWVAAVSVGMCLLFTYENRSGDFGQVKAHWPADTQLARADDRYTLLLFAHPRCPCTTATLDELAWVLTRRRDEVQCTVLFLQPDAYSLQPEDGAEEWHQSDNWARAASMPGVHVVADVGGIEAQRFGTKTSGHVIVFDPSGQRLFQGGITPSRGHRGDNLGRSMLLSLTNPHHTEIQSQDTVVYGCPLFAGESEDRK